jgi:hypothetical protein
MLTFLKYAFWTTLTIIWLLDVADRLSSLPSIENITLPPITIPSPYTSDDDPEPDNNIHLKTWRDI